MAPPTDLPSVPPPSVNLKERSSGKKGTQAVAGNGPVITNTRIGTPGIKDEAGPPAKDNIMLAAVFKDDLNSIKSLVTCSICDQLLYEPWTLSCGHTYCYSCLCNWFVPNRHKKTCPECRASIKKLPAPAFIIKQMVELFTRRVELMPADESVDQHNSKRQEETADVDRDKNGIIGLFKGAFSGGPVELHFDDEDGVFRCSECGHEHIPGLPNCEQCGAEIEEPVFSDTDVDVDEYSGLDDIQMDMVNGPNMLQRPYFDDDDEMEDSEDEEYDSSLEDFIIRDSSVDPGLEARPSDRHRNHDLGMGSAANPVSLDSEDQDEHTDTDDESPMVATRRNGHGGRNGQRSARVIQSSSPSSPSETSQGACGITSGLGDFEDDDASLLRRAGWSPLDHESDEERTPTPYEHYDYSESSSLSESEEEESDTNTMVGNVNEDDDVSRDATPVPSYGFLAGVHRLYPTGPVEYASDGEQSGYDESEVGYSSMDHDGDTEMSVSPDARHSQLSEVADYGNDCDGSSVSAGADGHEQQGEFLGVVSEVHDLTDDSSDDSIRPPPRRRPRNHHRYHRAEYNPHVSMLFAEHQQNLRTAGSQDSTGLNEMQGEWRIEPASSIRSRRLTSYRALPRRHEAIDASRVLPANERSSRSSRQYRAMR